MGFRIDEPIGAQMRYLDRDSKELLLAQRHFEYAQKTGNFNPLDMIALGLLDAAEAAGNEDAAAIRTAIEENHGHCGHKAEIGKNYQTKYKVWTERKGGLETAYQCHICGAWLVSDTEPDELSAKINETRAGTNAVAAPLLKLQTKRHQVKLTPEQVGSIPDTHRSLTG